MSLLTDQARQAARETLGLLDAAAEEGDLAATIAAALLGGHTLFLLADPSHTALAEALAGAFRRPFPAETWPPLVTITADLRPLALIGCGYVGSNPLSQQVEELVRRGDAVLALSGPQPSNDLIGAAGLAGSQGAAVLSLGPAFAKFHCQASVTVPSGAGILPADSALAGWKPAPHDAAPSGAGILPADPALAGWKPAPHDAAPSGAGIPPADPALAGWKPAPREAAPSGAGVPPADPAIAGWKPAPHGAAPERIAECQLLLGHALCEALARRLPAEPPAGIEPALLRSACTNCAAPLLAPRHLAGRQGVCPHCFNNTVLAPEAAAAEKRGHMRFALLDCSLTVSLVAPRPPEGHSQEFPPEGFKPSGGYSAAPLPPEGPFTNRPSGGYSADLPVPTAPVPLVSPPRGKPPLRVPGQITLENVSLGGLLFAIAGSPLELQPGDLVAMELSTPAFQQPLPLTGSVVRVTREAAVHRVGIVFGPLPPAVGERLRLLERNLVLRHLAARAPRP